MDAKFFIGPMSKNIVDTIIDFSIIENYKIGIIPSRRQIDWDGGYVNNWTTESFTNYFSDSLIRKNLIIERDHGGIGQGRYFDNGATSFYTDAKNFDIIHIDPWYKYKDFQQALDETVDNIILIHKINPNCLFEVGTEEAIYHFTDTMLNDMLFYLKNKLGDLFQNIKYCVIQSGTRLKGVQNTGKFDMNRLKKMLKVCKKYGILSKEHNGDYLSLDDIKIRFDAGLSAINIAPEFGVFETEIILEHMLESQKSEFFDICYNSNKWCKWVDESFEPYSNRTELMKICGHYQFSTPEFKKMNLKLDDIIKDRLYEKLKKMIEI
jgi:hypothetical protein